MEKSQDRIEILEKIKLHEKNGWFDKDVENDPPFEPLKPGDVDYLRKKLSSKIKNKYCNYLLKKFTDKQIKNHNAILKEIVGIEKLNGLKSGAMVTSNHFNPFDSFPIRQMLRDLDKKKKLHMVIGEHNYSGGQGFYGFLFRNQNTLPLAQNKELMMQCYRAVDYYLKKGDWVLIYPEQAMWWNYRKPRPLKEGAFRFAVKSNVPIIACMITMQDSEYVGNDGFFVQEYTLHILDVLYPDEKLNAKENIAMLKARNEELMKQKYEEVYGIKLSYDTEDGDNR